MGIYKRKQESKKERKHALHHENDQEKKKVFSSKNINRFYFQPLSVVICHFVKNEAKCLILICVFHLIPFAFLDRYRFFLESYILGCRERVNITKKKLHHFF